MIPSYIGVRSTIDAIVWERLSKTLKEFDPEQERHDKFLSMEFFY